MGGQATCDLCGLPVLGAPIRSEGHSFCCEGCRRVWEVADQSGIDTLLDSSANRAERSRRADERKRGLARASGARSETLRVEGMWCSSCALVLEDALMDLPGVLDAQVSYAGSMARVTWDPAALSAEDVAARVALLGYSARPAREALAERRDAEDVFLRFFVSLAVGMWVMWPTLLVLYPAYARGVFDSDTALTGFTAVFSLVVLVYGGWPFLRGAYNAARVGRATMDTLVVLGTWSAWLYSIYALLTRSGPTYFESAAMITTIVLLGRWLEALGTKRATSALADLAESAVAEAWLVPEGGNVADAQRVPLEQLAPGALVAVRPGERVPADGTVAEGTSDIDRSRLTGEPVPVATGPGEEVWAGTINLSAVLLVRVTRVGTESLAGRLGAIMEDAVFAKSTAQRLADAISRVFVPVVIAIAAGAALISLATGLGLAEGVSRAVAVLVVACPCALGLATPLATTNAIAAGTRNGLLIRGGATLERSDELAVVAFDKTGTLTYGTPGIVGALGPDGSDVAAAGLAAIAAPLEAGEPHPVAAAITALARAGADAPAAASPASVERLAGMGLAAGSGRERTLVGNEALLASGGVELPTPARDAAQAARARGELVVWVARGGELVGGLRFADRIREEAPAVIAWLREQHIEPAIVSGDAQATCDAVARELGIELVYGEVMPHEKDSVVDRLAREHGPVAFVGDGVNDAAALASADLAIAVSGGSDVAVWGADVVLLGEQAPTLASLPPLVRIAHAAQRVVRQNLAWAFTYNLVTVPLAVSGRLSPIVAAAAMALSSLAVVANSARLAGRR